MSAITKVFKNLTQFIHIGRPHDITEKVLPLGFIDHACPLGANLWVPPGAIHVDVRGQMGMAMNSANTFWCLALGTKEGIEADLAALGKTIEEMTDVQEFKGKLPDGLVAFRFRFLPAMINEVTSQHQNTLAVAGDTVQSTLRIGQLQDSLKKQQEEHEKAKAELAETKAKLIALQGSPAAPEGDGKRSTFPKGK